MAIRRCCGTAQCRGATADASAYHLHFRTASLARFYACFGQAKADMKDLVSMVRAAAPSPAHAPALSGPRGPLAHTPVSRAVHDAEEMLAAMRRCVRALLKTFRALFRLPVALPKKGPIWPCFRPSPVAIS